MILPSLVVAVAVVVAVLYRRLRKQPDQRSLWRAALRIGFLVGVTRAALASWGWYMVEHTGGPLQIPAFALAMMAWPEAAIISQRRVAPVPPGFYILLSLVLVTGTMMFVSVLALAVGLTRVRPEQPGT